MASNPPAQATSYPPSETHTFVYGKEDEGPREEWNPTEDSLRPIRGRHRVGKQRGGGGLARSSTVLGVGVIAAVGAGGMATAAPNKPPVSISLPDLPSVSTILSDDTSDDEAEGSTTPLSSAGLTTAETEQGTADAGEVLRARIMQQAEVQKDQADTAAQQAAQAAAVKKAADDAAAVKKAADAKEAAAKKKAAEEAAAKAEAERLAELAKSYTLPTSSYTITSTFGQAGSLWSSGYHTGLDFAAPTGTLIKAIHSGTITSAGWDGSYGYKTVLTLDDGTELWFAHQSSISVSVGQKVATGDVIGRVGATGNVTGAHLHLEVHPGGADTGIDPMAWLQSKGINP
ncbi:MULTISPECIES: M23 family metallopeptidase [unclassified Streptomyces]|uniref:M23 family metallopeptidase n=1 Tax=unclassified Streptomyces TaxID=2593676 RepID=UPI0022507622|nr:MULTISPECIES: M23 family metallopeptidase [unclassified Streptomyces]MCX4973294.1 M23 family metallopeptidase [Streptomyces sp. NBC_00620]WUC12290.1 M23 family metallopeptidase [Streptomyces sp. NBC_00564]WUC51166.1 M23 family metallopeptidase [Streptomyces sp. NBC_00554]